MRYTQVATDSEDLDACLDWNRSLKLPGRTLWRRSHRDWSLNGIGADRVTDRQSDVVDHIVHRVGVGRVLIESVRRHGAVTKVPRIAEGSVACT